MVYSWKFRRPRTVASALLLAPGVLVLDTERAAAGFSIPPAFHQTLWFRLLCAAVLLVLAWLMLLMRVEQVKGRVRERLHERRLREPPALAVE
ncbi:MAG TPA: hypothetical protein VNY82_00865 [Steroidobacteraceae bacterium]|nr:hypothetical protein [Steroidobacteraceae bacterium]